jgi:hypothetical protein
MYKQHLLKNIEREIILLKEIAPFIQEKDLEYRPVDKVRTTYELMQYLSTIGEVIFRWMIKNDITPEVRKEIADYRSSLTIGNFSERMELQWTNIQKYMNELTDEDLFTKEAELPWKEKMVLGQAIINCPIKWLAVYRMELFLYLKINGHSELGTKEAWIPKELQIQPA